MASVYVVATTLRWKDLPAYCRPAKPSKAFDGVKKGFLADKEYPDLYAKEEAKERAQKSDKFDPVFDALSNQLDPEFADGANNTREFDASEGDETIAQLRDFATKIDWGVGRRGRPRRASGGRLPRRAPRRRPVVSEMPRDAVSKILATRAEGRPKTTPSGTGGLDFSRKSQPAKTKDYSDRPKPKVEKEVVKAPGTREQAPTEMPRGFVERDAARKKAKAEAKAAARAAAEAAAAAPPPPPAGFGSAIQTLEPVNGKRRIKVVAGLDGVSSFSELDLDVGAATMRVKELKGSLRSLAVALPFAPEPTSAQAKFSKKRGQLTVTLTEA